MGMIDWEDAEDIIQGYYTYLKNIYLKKTLFEKGLEAEYLIHLANQGNG